MGQSKYDVSFKRESVQMLEDGVSVVEASKKPGVHEKTLYRWRDEYRSDGQRAFPGKGNLSPLDSELHRQERESWDPREKNEILKKRRPYLQNKRNVLWIHV